MPYLRHYLRALLLASLLAGCHTSATQPESHDVQPTSDNQDGFRQLIYQPAHGPAPIVVLLSGFSGTPLHEDYAAELAKENYYVVLLDGKDILTSDESGEEKLKKAIIRAQHAPSAVGGRAAVIGFSYGGGAALVYAANLPELVSNVVVYFPFTSFADANALAARFRVPVLFLAGQQDRYNNCCTIEMAHAIYLAAKDRLAPFTLIAYPDAGHGFSLAGFDAYRADDAEDAWRRTLAALREHLRADANTK